MTNPTNAPEGANTPALSAVPILAGSTRLPSVEIMTFAEADAEVVVLLAAANSKRGKGEEAEREADFNVVVACELREAILSTPPLTLADALAMLNRLACEESGMPGGMIPRQESAVVLLRDFVAALVEKGVSNAHTPPPSAAPDPKGADLPVANPVMPTDPDAIGPNAVAVVAFWEGYMGIDGLVMDWIGDGDDDRLETRFADLAEEFQAAVVTAGPPVSVMDALALASLQHELLNEAAGLKPYTVFGARGVALKAIAGQLVQLVPVG